MKIFETKKLKIFETQKMKIFETQKMKIFETKKNENFWLKFHFDLFNLLKTLFWVNSSIFPQIFTQLRKILNKKNL